MGMSNIKIKNLQEDENDQKSIIELINENERKNDDKEEKSVKMNVEEEKLLPESPRSKQNKNANVPHWQRNLQTFYNSTGR
jgi:hypothetical protein